MKRRLTIFSALLSPVLAVLLFICLSRWVDAEQRIEAGVLYEMVLVGDRAFLMSLPAAVIGTQDNAELLKFLQQKFPDSTVELYKNGIAWGGHMLVELSQDGHLLRIRELDEVERQSLVDRAFNNPDE